MKNELQIAVEKFTPMLTERIQEFLNLTCEIEADCQQDMGWQGDNLARLMAKAAMSVWESSADVQDYLHREELMA